MKSKKYIYYCPKCKKIEIKDNYIGNSQYKNEETIINLRDGFGTMVHHYKCECGNYLAGCMAINDDDKVSIEYGKAVIDGYNPGGAFYNNSMSCKDGEELMDTAKRIYSYRQRDINYKKCCKNDNFEGFSDGYHTFGELYHHRAILSAALFNSHKDIAWKSLQHNDPKNNPMYDGMFICGINTPEGQATYHYDKDKYWDLFDIPILECAPEYDGHTPDEAIRRIEKLFIEKI